MTPPSGEEPVPPPGSPPLRLEDSVGMWCSEGEARMHVREETPFFTGPCVSVEHPVDSLP